MHIKRSCYRKKSTGLVSQDSKRNISPKEVGNFYVLSISEDISSSWINFSLHNGKTNISRLIPEASIIVSSFINGFIQPSFHISLSLSWLDKYIHCPWWHLLWYWWLHSVFSLYSPFHYSIPFLSCTLSSECFKYQLSSTIISSAEFQVNSSAMATTAGI